LRSFARENNCRPIFGICFGAFDRLKPNNLDILINGYDKKTSHPNFKNDLLDELFLKKTIFFIPYLVIQLLYY
jgi:hypothetical protein